MRYLKKSTPQASPARSSKPMGSKALRLRHRPTARGVVDSTVLRYFFRRHTPHLRRVLLVESGSRLVLAQFLASRDSTMRPDLVTCYAGAPKDFSGDIFRVQDYTTPESRSALIRELRNNRYDAIGVLATDEAIMTKWKWLLAARIPAKLFLINENADWFWIDYRHLNLIWHFFSFRAGMSGAGAVTTPLRLLLFPFTLLYLGLFAARIHLRRKLGLL